MVRQQYSCFILNFYLVLCGLLLVIISSTLSLKTVHRTIFFTLALESLLSLCLYNKKEHRKVFFLWCANRDSNPGPTGYEPVALTNWAIGAYSFYAIDIISYDIGVVNIFALFYTNYWYGIIQSVYNYSPFCN